MDLINRIKGDDDRTWECSPTESYGILGWIEVAIKTCGCLVGIFSWVQFIKDGERSISEKREFTTGRYVEIALFVIILIWYILTILMRAMAREIFGFIYQFILIGNLIFLKTRMLYCWLGGTECLVVV
eukprot:TRINITY_DN2053_c0_g1_i1.p1 TRINITY_DN2053_c0_g1~~TRINITY_DN2053_c0_g1_i1.p1  ORF type:complete len:128 (-),score=12.49 TRINITY_DN2053_c0_g1_i1:579-962(-)